MSYRTRQFSNRPPHRSDRDRRPNRYSEHQNNHGSMKRLLTIIALVIACLTGLGIMGYLVYDSLGKLKPDKMACYETGEPQAQSVVLVDSSEPRFTPVQSRDLMTAFTDYFKHDLRFNERFRLIITDPSKIGTVPDPVLELCGGARSGEELEEIGAAHATKMFLTKQNEKTFQKTIRPVLEQVFATDAPAGQSQRFESPILEQIQNVSRMRGFSNPNTQRRLYVVSDLIQSTEKAQFCSKKGDLPKFKKFKKTSYYKRIKPRSLSGVSVTVQMLVRPGLGRGDFKFCTENELATFWKIFFKDAGAASVDIIRLRDASYIKSGQ